MDGSDPDTDLDDYEPHTVPRSRSQGPRSRSQATAHAMPGRSLMSSASGAAPHTRFPGALLPVSLDVCFPGTLPLAMGAGHELPMPASEPPAFAQSLLPDGFGGSLLQPLGSAPPAVCFAPSSSTAGCSSTGAAPSQPRDRPPTGPSGRRTPYAKYTSRCAPGAPLPQLPPAGPTPLLPPAAAAVCGPVISFSTAGAPQHSAHGPGLQRSIGGGIVITLPTLQRTGSATARLQSTPNKHPSPAPDDPPAKRTAHSASQRPPLSGPTAGSTAVPPPPLAVPVLQPRGSLAQLPPLPSTQPSGLLGPGPLHVFGGPLPPHAPLEQGGGSYPLCLAVATGLSATVTSGMATFAPPPPTRAPPLCAWPDPSGAALGPPLELSQPSQGPSQGPAEAYPPVLGLAAPPARPPKPVALAAAAGGPAGAEGVSGGEELRGLGLGAELGCGGSPTQAFLAAWGSCDMDDLLTEMPEPPPSARHRLQPAAPQVAPVPVKQEPGAEAGARAAGVSGRPEVATRPPVAGLPTLPRLRTASSGSTPGAHGPARPSSAPVPPPPGLLLCAAPPDTALARELRTPTTAALASVGACVGLSTPLTGLAGQPRAAAVLLGVKEEPGCGRGAALTAALVGAAPSPVDASRLYSLIGTPPSLFKPPTSPPQPDGRARAGTPSVQPPFQSCQLEQLLHQQAQQQPQQHAQQQRVLAPADEPAARRPSAGSGPGPACSVASEALGSITLAPRPQPSQGRSVMGPAGQAEAQARERERSGQAGGTQGQQVRVSRLRLARGSATGERVLLPACLAPPADRLRPSRVSAPRAPAPRPSKSPRLGRPSGPPAAPWATPTRPGRPS
jgi:hypothetical protein